MHAPNAIRARWRHPLLRPLRFGAVGLACSGVQLAVLVTLVELGLRHDVANLAALLVSTQASFLLSAAFIWPDRPLAARAAGRWLRRLLAFNLTSFATLLLNEVVYLLALPHAHYVVAAICGIAVAAPANYLIEHYLVFRPHRARGHGFGPV
ncbi:MAG TPA: GtrA family protein [Thermomicrobiaceae bacterium]|nr:GtrA family protein [Thermomicrobiaceae bacterium]